jgi:hypothetical protein
MGERAEIVPAAGVTPAAVAAPTSAPRSPSAGRLLFRFAVGGSGLVAEWLAAALRAVDELPAPADERPADVAPGARAVVVGALSSALRWRPRPTGLGRAARGAERAARRGLHLIEHAPGAAAVRRRYARAQAGVASQLRRWAEEGAREERAGRRLARLAAPGFFELGVARLADSPELRGVIEEQSQGLAASSVAELRERSEHADRAVERIVRRVLGRKGNGHARAAGKRW